MTRRKGYEVASDVAQDAAAEAKRKTLPISVFVSRKTQRFYVRQGYVPVFEGPITIRDPEKPVGTYVFTALGDANERVRWGVVSMYANGNNKAASEPVAARKGEARRSIEAKPGRRRRGQSRPRPHRYPAGSDPAHHRRGAARLFPHRLRRGP